MPTTWGTFFLEGLAPSQAVAPLGSVGPVVRGIVSAFIDWLGGQETLRRIAEEWRRVETNDVSGG